MHEFDEKLLQRLDAAGPDGADGFAPDDPALDDPAARELLGRIQETDQALGAAMHNVPVPDGLADRLLAELNASEPGEDFAREEYSPARSRRLSPWKWAAAVASVACGVAVVVFLHFRPERVTIEQIVGEVDELYNEHIAAVADEQWQIRASSLLPDEAFAVPADIRGEFRPSIRWRQFQLAGNRAVAHDLTGPRHAAVHQDAPRRVTLLAIKRRVVGLPRSVPLVPQSTSLGRCVGVWQSEQFVYVLVVEGTPDHYRTVIRTTAGLT